MKIILYTDENIIIDIFENIQNPEVILEKSSICWENNQRITGINQNFAIVNDDIPYEKGGVFDPSHDIKFDFIREDLDQKQEQDLIDIQLALTELYEMILSLKG